MKLFYITRVNIPSKAAQSIQINAMCQVFGELVTDFKLISPLNSENKDLSKSYLWQKIPLKTPFRYLEFVIKIFKIVLIEKPTHVFTRDIVVAFACSFLKQIVAYEAHKEPRSKIAHWLMCYIRKQWNFKLITISSALKMYYINQYNFTEIQILDCHDGVFIEQYDKYRDISKVDLRKKLGLPVDKAIVMHTGSLYAGRGAEYFEIILKNFQDYLFVQVGGTEQDILKYKVYYKSYKNIIFVQYQDNQNLIKYQMSSDLLFYPMTRKTMTYWCCSPMKVFEYMATGIPILGSSIGSVGEVLNESNCITYNPEHEQSIVDGMNFYLQNPINVNYRAQKALEEIRNQYVWKRRAKNILGFIKL